MLSMRAPSKPCSGDGSSRQELPRGCALLVSFHLLTCSYSVEPDSYVTIWLQYKRKR